MFESRRTSPNNLREYISIKGTNTSIDQEMSVELDRLFLRERDLGTDHLSLIARSSVTQSISNPMPSELNEHGCVVCPDTPSCPVCGTNEQCAMTTQTCLECPTTYCLTISDNYNETKSDSLTNAQVGGIAGGLSAFVLIILAGLIYYLFKKVRANAQTDFELGINEEMKELTGLFDDDYDYKDSGPMNTNLRTNRRRTLTNSEYKRMSQNSLSTVTNSVLTKASNVLNIVYVPGVTSSRPAKPPSIGGTRRNTRKPAASIYSRGMSVYSKETYFSDLENASFHGGKVALKGVNPALVDINQDDYDFDSNEGDDQIILENDDSDLDEDALNESGGIPLDINFKLPGRRDIEQEIVEEEEEEEGEDDNDLPRSRRASRYRTKERFSGNYGKYVAGNEGEVGNGDAHGVRTNITTQRTVPTRYAALIAKKDETNKAMAEASETAEHQGNDENEDPFTHRPMYINYDAQGISSNESESESSDSDEENIEFLLQHSNNNTNNNSSSLVYTTAGGATSGSSVNATARINNENGDSNDPFSSPLDHGHP